MTFMEAGHIYKVSLEIEDAVYRVSNLCGKAVDGPCHDR